MDHQYRENAARNMYSNYYQMRAYVECSPNYTVSIFPSSSEDSGKVLAVSVFYQSTAVQLYQPTLIRWLSSVYVYK